MSTLFSYFFENINQISPQEHDFTEVLEAIALKPKTLYFHGKLPENVVKTPNPQNILHNKSQNESTVRNRTARPKTVAIVGSRHNTNYGEAVAYKMAYELAKHGVVIVSGLAYGIDSIAHQATLDAGGVTVAVLGTPIDQIYPRRHLPLATDIIKHHGAIISEYAPGTQVFPKASFLERNRIISGLSDIVVVVEAAEHSGSLNTAAHALSQGKTVFAVPGNITNPYSVGCNKLIEQGATPYTSPDDLLRLLFPTEHQNQRKAHKIHGDTPVETAILKAISEGCSSGDVIIEKLGLSTAEFNETITLLEIKGLAHALGANHWSLY